MSEKKVVVVIGNLSKSKKKNSTKWYFWKAFVRCYDDVIESVDFFLHSGRVIKVEKPPFQMSTSGWGMFRIDITVTFTDGQRKSFSHDLKFGIPDSEWHYSEVKRYMIKVKDYPERSVFEKQIDDYDCEPLQKIYDNLLRTISSCDEDDLSKADAYF